MIGQFFYEKEMDGEWFRLTSYSVKFLATESFFSQHFSGKTRI